MRMNSGPGLVLAAALSASGLFAAAMPVGQSAGDFHLQGLTKNDVIRLSAYKGQVVLIDFWASWCAPCKKSLPELRRLKAELPAATFLAISEDEEKAKARRFLATSDPEGLVTLLDSAGKVAGQFGVEGMPTALLIDRKGVLRFRHDGYSVKDLERIKIELQVLLKEAP